MDDVSLDEKFVALMRQIHLRQRDINLMIQHKAFLFRGSDDEANKLKYFQELQAVSQQFFNAKLSLGFLEGKGD